MIAVVHVQPIVASTGFSLSTSLSKPTSTCSSSNPVPPHRCSGRGCGLDSARHAGAVLGGRVARCRRRSQATPGGLRNRHLRPRRHVGRGTATLKLAKAIAPPCSSYCSTMSATAAGTSWSSPQGGSSRCTGSTMQCTRGTSGISSRSTSSTPLPWWSSSSSSATR
jgi:hypothetical protein